MVGNLETKTGTAGETTFAYDENGLHPYSIRGMK